MARRMSEIARSSPAAAGPISFSTSAATRRLSVSAGPAGVWVWFLVRVCSTVIAAVQSREIVHVFRVENDRPMKGAVRPDTPGWVPAHLYGAFPPTPAVVGNAGAVPDSARGGDA